MTTIGKLYKAYNELLKLKGITERDITNFTVTIRNKGVNTDYDFKTMYSMVSFFIDKFGCVNAEWQYMSISFTTVAKNSYYLGFAMFNRNNEPLYITTSF